MKLQEVYNTKVVLYNSFNNTHLLHTLHISLGIKIKSP